MAANPGLRTNRWGSPIITPGQTLQAPSLQGLGAEQLARLGHTGGQIIGRNSQSLNARAQWLAAQQARAAAQAAAQQAAARQSQGMSPEEAHARYMAGGSRSSSYQRALGEDYRNRWSGAGQSPVANALARARQSHISALPDDPITRFFTGNAVGRTWRGASEAALGFIPNMVGSAGDALADMWDYATGTTRSDSVLSPEAASYRMRTPLMQTFANEGLSPALGQLVTGTVRGMPGISLIDALGQPSRDWDAVGAAAAALGRSNIPGFGASANAWDRRPYAHTPLATRAEYEAIYGANAVSSSTVPPFGAPNVWLAGQRHPHAPIVFDYRGLPIFDDVAMYDTRLNPSDFLAASYQGQMRMASRDLWQSIQRGEVPASRFTSEQLLAIQRGSAKIPGYTWHHHQDNGRMQLIPTVIHSAVGHIGGNSISK